MIRKNSINTMKRKNILEAYLLISPQLIGFLVFSLYPVIWVFKYVWYDYDKITAVFTGFNNLIRVFANDINYWKSLLNTFILSFGKLVIELPVSLILAVLLTSKIKGKNFYRTFFYMPNVISVAIIGVVFSYIFSSFEGIANEILMALRLVETPVNWFANKWTSMSVIAIASIWQNFGINMLFFMSGLMNIPKDLYECSDIDGANKFQQFIHITIPMLYPVIQIIFMLAIIGSIKSMDLVLTLSNGQPAGETEVVMTYIFKKFFNYGDNAGMPQVGYACALGFVTSIIIGILTVFYLKTTKKMSEI